MPNCTKSKLIFVVTVSALALQRLLELRLSQRHETRIRQQGGREHTPEHFGAMKLLHTAWFGAMLGEVILLDRRFKPGVAAVAFMGLLLGQSLRYAAIRTLGPRWTVRIMTLPEAPPVTHGIYRYLRHPNYIGVALEIAAVPLLHNAYGTAVVFTAANAGLLFIRIRAEEEALYTS